MDWEKFENLLIDELYGELDEVTSAAVRRHAAGCARCGALLSGLRATRKVAALPIEEPSSDLEDRILSAVREQQKVLPFRARFAVGLSRAGAWAMRPQTAMAAVFLVVIGTSFVLVQSRKNAPAASAQAGASFAEGAPVATAAPGSGAMASAYALDRRDTDFAHGVEEKKAPDQTITATPAATLAANELPANGPAKDKDDGDGMGRGGGGNATGGQAGDMRTRDIANASPIGGARLPTTTNGNVDVSKTAVEAQAQAAPPADPSVTLAAGRAEKARNGGTCTQAALQSFEATRQRAPSGSALANDATMEAGHCYRAMGNTTLARARFSSLLTQPGYASAAQNELDQLAPAAAAHAHRLEAPAPVRAPTQVDQKAGY